MIRWYPQPHRSRLRLGLVQSSDSYSPRCLAKMIRGIPHPQFFPRILEIPMTRPDWGWGTHAPRGYATEMHPMHPRNRSQ